MKLFTGWRLGGSLLVGSIAVANVLNFAFNAYLGRVLTPGDFGVLSFVASLVYLVSIPMDALQGTASHQTAFLEGREGRAAARAVLLQLRRNMLLVGAVGVAVWLVLTPWLTDYFQLSSRLPTAVFAVVPVVGFALAVDRGRLSGHLLFGALGAVTIGEAFMKLALGVGFVRFGWASAAYVAIPLSIVGTFGMTQMMINTTAPAAPAPALANRPRGPALQWRFFLTALLSGFAAMTFLTFDVLLAKHFLPPDEAGQYALISLIGKIVFFLGTLCNQLLIPLVSRAEGERSSTRMLLGLVLLPALLLSLLGFVAFGLEAHISAPIMFGAAGNAAVAGAPWIAAGAMCFAVTRVFVSYHLARRQYAFVIAASALVTVQVALIAAHHATPLAIAQAMALTGLVQLAVILLLHLASPNTSSLGWNLSSLTDMFMPNRPASQRDDGHAVRIFVTPVAPGPDVEREEIS